MKRILGILIVIALLTTVPAFGAETRIGYVDLQKALNLSQAGKEAKDKIAARVKEYEGTIDSRQKELKKLKEELEKQAVLLSEDARANKERDYQQKLKEFQRFTKDIQEELQQKDADFTRQILENLFNVLKEIGKNESYTIILEKSESSVLYADESIDLTEKLISKYDANFQKEKGN